MEYAVKCVRTYLCACFMIGSNLVICIFFQSVGKALPSTALSFLRQVILLIPAIVILGNMASVEGILWAGPFSDGVSGIISIIVVAVYWKKIFAKGEEKHEL